MAVPEEIRRVERPTNTVVVDRGGNGPKRYAVVERVGCRRVNGKNRPVDGRTVGHIICGRYVPKGPKADDGNPRDPVEGIVPEVRGWACPKLVWQEAEGLFDELVAVFDGGDAVNALAIACMRVIHKGIRDGELAEAYERDGLVDLLPGAQLSKNKVSKFLEALGRARGRIAAFMRARVERVARDHHIAIDGTLKQDNSRVNDLSQYSRKTRVKGTRDAGILYAFDVEEREPICGKVYAGNVVDSVAYEDFLTEHGIKRGLVVGDKAFSHAAARKALDAHADLHWMNPLKRNDKRIEEHGMYDWEGMLDIPGRDVKYKKVKVGEGKDAYWLYSFYDRARAAKEELDWFARARGKDYDKEKADPGAKRFGTVVFECDLDLEPEVAWTAYDERWLIEDMFKYYKQGLELDDTRVHSEDSVYGSEFVNFLATTITSRLVKRFEKCGLLDKYTYGKIMCSLRSAQAVRTGEGGAWVAARTPKYVESIVETLGLDLAS